MSKPGFAAQLQRALQDDGHYESFHSAPTLPGCLEEETPQGDGSPIQHLEVS